MLKSGDHLEDELLNSKQVKGRLGQGGRHNKTGGIEQQGKNSLKIQQMRKQRQLPSPQG